MITGWLRKNEIHTLNLLFVDILISEAIQSGLASGT